MSVNVAELPGATVWAEFGVTCSSEDLLEFAVIEMLVEELWLTLIVPVPSKLRPNVEGVVVILQTSGVGVGVGVARGVGVALGVGVGVAVGVGVGLGMGVGVGVGVGDAFGSTPSTGSVPPVVSGVGAGVVVSGVGTGVAPADKSPTLSLTSGTSSSKTLLSMVMSPDPVMSIETASTPFFNVIETCALGIVFSPTVFQVRPRQSKPIVSTVSNSTPDGRSIVRVSMPPSPSRSIVTL